ncbi:uncharacterized protein MONBRDRAFT_33556 [Monosiga brevicollis MX1]|uniref:Cytochrome c domain-containing protein n=1 Tax=Monosiga brevicollis TaxID=81824 RepID=A9V619_MONBE|nr:uncharacterized protein MONBRDRAFT_33556 [Monosiga brevicollis MX1]EDQ86908.1 predicted protein [Monosiga brevicollis MX1]|eukprot:XP_001748147.1 hypothetical protein [Monosiga brevicollis MX1]
MGRGGAVAAVVALLVVAGCVVCHGATARQGRIYVGHDGALNLGDPELDTALNQVQVNDVDVLGTLNELKTLANTASSLLTEVQTATAAGQARLIDAALFRVTADVGPLPNATETLGFARRLALDKRELVIGTRNDSVDIFLRPANDEWSAMTHLQTLIATPNLGNYARSLALSNGVLAVAAVDAGGAGRGVVLVYRRDELGSFFALRTTLGHGASSTFGTGIAFLGAALYVGDPTWNSIGAIYTYTDPLGASPQPNVTGNPSPNNCEFFGRRIAVAKDRIASLCIDRILLFNPTTFVPLPGQEMMGTRVREMAWLGTTLAAIRQNEDGEDQRITLYAPTVVGGPYLIINQIPLPFNTTTSSMTRGLAASGTTLAVGFLKDAMTPGHVYLLQ